MAPLTFVVDVAHLLCSGALVSFWVTLNFLWHIFSSLLRNSAFSCCCSSSPRSVTFSRQNWGLLNRTLSQDSTQWRGVLCSPLTVARKSEQKWSYYHPNKMWRISLRTRPYSHSAMQIAYVPEQPNNLTTIHPRRQKDRNNMFWLFVNGPEWLCDKGPTKFIWGGCVRRDFHICEGN